jgi:PAS domain S-box-containing protein
MRDDDKTREALLDELHTLRAQMNADIVPGDREVFLRRAQRALRESEARFQAFMDHSPALAWMKDEQLRYVYRNKPAEERFQKTLEECRGRTVFEVWPPDVAQVLWETDQVVLRTDQPAEFCEQLPLPDGQVRNWLVYKFPFRDAEGRRFVGGMAVDITEQKTAEQAVRDSEALYKSLVDCLPQSIFRKSLDGTFTFANQRFCAGLGRSAAEILSKTDFDFYPRDLAAKYRHDDQHVIETRQLLHTEEEHVLPDGKRTFVEVVKSPVYDAAGRVIGTQAIFWDITERKLLHEQLLNSQRMEAVGHLAAGVAHDFRNLLTAIIGNMALAEDQVTGPARALVADTLKASHRAIALVNQLLTFSRKTPVAITAVELSPVINEVVDIARKTFDRRIDIRLHMRNGVRALADPGQIHQAVLNLLINARDALDEGRRPSAAAFIEVTMEPATINAAYCAQHLEARPGQYARIAVADTGVGMDRETQRRIFDPFFTTKEVGKGTGLGLATTYGIVQQHGGWIEVNSEVGRGTTIAFYLPLDRAAAAVDQAKPAAEAPLTGGTETVLLVDDEEIVRQVGRRILERYGYTVVEAHDGQGAVELYRKRGGEFQLVILDLSMPRLSGEEALTHLWLHNSAIKVIVASGFFTDADAERLRKKGAAALVGKPFRVADMVRTVRQVLDG